MTNLRDQISKEIEQTKEKLANLEYLLQNIETFEAQMRLQALGFYVTGDSVYVRVK